MFSFVIFALLSVASAQYVSQYGVNPIADKYPVPTIGQNYGYAAQKIVPAHYNAAQVYAGPGVGYSRDFNVEQIGEKYAYQNGPASFQYSFLKGADLQGVHGVQPAVAAYGVPHQVAHQVPHHARVAAEIPHYGAQYPTSYGVSKYQTY